ncbi:hypothetical protein J2128_001144 [Methanomicrobium sp. W14]|uniref:hypothetical protein n=1 Tax=Methanomicrobium sp. W14 TaxID=2817839 RepID=UPI001AE5BEE3|nr:hypothetical protein [Methanomicrobium sp. W14]MBP2133223.1 hypothetical protein [Methanomicrobium sp. W14]
MIFIIFPVSAESAGSSWNFTEVDTGGNAGFYCSLDFNPVTHYPAISYKEPKSDSLRFAW